MRSGLLLLFACVLHSFLGGTAAAQEADTIRLVLCNQAVPEIAIWEISGEEGKKVWAWTPEDDPGLPEDGRKWFSNPSEAKPTRDGKRLMICAGGGAALVSIEEKRVVWLRKPGGNPHSIAELGNGDLVVASSTGDLLSHYRLDSEDAAPMDRLEVKDAHGVVWDQARKRLWALGSLTLHSFALGEGGRLEEDKVVDLPVLDRKNALRNGGHDLVWKPGGDSLLLSDAFHLWEFHPETSAFELVGELDRVKSITFLDGKMAVVRAKVSWWSDEVTFLDGTTFRKFEGNRIYKARNLGLEP